MIYHGDALAYIYQTPEILTNIVRLQQEIMLEVCNALKKKSITEIYITGSGSSYHSALAAKKYIQTLLGIQVHVVYPVMFIENIEFLAEEAMLIGISQQGTSTAVIAALDKMHKSGRITISMTGEHHTEITKHSDANIYIECGYEDAGATTKGFTSSVLTLMLFALQYAKTMGRVDEKKYEYYQNRMNRTIHNMPQLIQKAELWCNTKSDCLCRTKDLIVIAGCEQKSILLETVLKFSETCRFPVRGYEAEEFMHGMYNAVGEKTEFMYIFSRNGKGMERMQQLYNYYEEQGYQQYVINGKNADSLKNCFSQDDMYSLLELILPIQVLFVQTSRKKGIDLNIPKDPNFHKIMRSKIENEKDLFSSKS